MYGASIQEKIGQATTARERRTLDSRPREAKRQDQDLSMILDYAQHQEQECLEHPEDNQEIIASFQAVIESQQTRIEALEKQVSYNSCEKEVQQSLQNELNSSRSDNQEKTLKIKELEEKLSKLNKSFGKRATTKRWLQTMRNRAILDDPREVKELVDEALLHADVDISVLCVLGGFSCCMLFDFNNALKYFEKGGGEVLKKSQVHTVTVDGTGFDTLCSMLHYLLAGQADANVLHWPFQNCGDLSKSMFLDWILICCRLVPLYREPLLSIAKPMVLEGYCGNQTETLFWEEVAGHAVNTFFSTGLEQKEKSRYEKVLKQLSEEFESNRICYSYNSLLFLKDPDSKPISENEFLHEIARSGDPNLFFTLSDLEILIIASKKSCLNLKDIEVLFDKLNLKAIEWKIPYDPLVKFLFQCCLKRIAAKVNGTLSREGWSATWNAIPCNLREKVDEHVMQERKRNGFQQTQRDLDVFSWNAKEIVFKFGRNDNNMLVSELPATEPSCIFDEVSSGEED